MITWGETILDLASNIYWVVGIFFFFTLILHILFVFWFPLSLRAWKLADYFWLTLALLSVLGLVGEAQQFRAEQAHNEVEWATTQSLNDVRGWYSNYQIFTCAEAKNLKQKNITGSQYQELCTWLEGRINDLNLLQKSPDPFPALTSRLTDGLATYSAIVPRLEQKILAQRITRYSENRNRHLNNIEARQRTTLQRILLIMAPVMFALALAIRFTKVTAEYRLLRPSR